MQRRNFSAQTLAVVVCACLMQPLARGTGGDSAPTPAPQQASAESRKSSAASVTARIKPKRVRAGDIFTIEIAARDATNTGSIFFHLVFDPTLVVPIPSGFTEGGWLKQRHAATRFLAAPASTGDRILVGIARLGSRGGAPAAGVACRLTFRALAAGETAIAFDRAGLSSPAGNAIPSRFATTTLTIRPPASTGAP